MNFSAAQRLCAQGGSSCIKSHHAIGLLPSGGRSGAIYCIKRDTKRGRARWGEKRSFRGANAEGGGPRRLSGGRGRGSRSRWSRTRGRRAASAAPPGREGHRPVFRLAGCPTTPGRDRRSTPRDRSRCRSGSATSCGLNDRAGCRLEYASPNSVLVMFHWQPGTAGAPT